MNKLMILGVVSTSLLVSACTPMTPKTEKYKQVETSVSNTVNVDEQLTNAAYSVQESLRTLAASKEVYELNAINTDPLVTPEGGMGQRITFDWSGPIEPLLYRIANLTGYSLKVLGPSPGVPVVVTILAENRQIADVVKDAGLQSANRANLVVYPGSRVIELRYVRV